MHLRYAVLLEVDPQAVDGLPHKVMHDELSSHREGLKCVRGCRVYLTGPDREATAEAPTNQGSTAMNATAEQTTEHAETTERPKGKAHRLPHQGNINTTVFENHGANGTFYTADIQRSYMDGETRKFTHSFKPTDMPDVMKQAEAVQAKVGELTKAQGQSR